MSYNHLPTPPKRPWPIATVIVIAKVIAAYYFIKIVGPFWIIGIAFCILIPMCV